MMTVIATLRVKEGQEQEFEALASEMMKAVNENEEGCLYYQAHRTDDPQCYIFIERYKDEAATEAHRSSDHYRSIGARMGAHMAGRPEIQILHQI
jgi:quinol monooxygenase YgiN